MTKLTQTLSLGPFDEKFFLFFLYQFYRPIDNVPDTFVSYGPKYAEFNFACAPFSLLL